MGCRLLTGGRTKNGADCNVTLSFCGVTVWDKHETESAVSPAGHVAGSVR